MRKDFTHDLLTSKVPLFIIPFQRELGFKMDSHSQTTKVVSIHSPQPETKLIIFLFHVLLLVMEVARNLKLKPAKMPRYHWGARSHKRLRVWSDLRNGFSHHHQCLCLGWWPGPGVTPMVRKNIPLWNYIHFPVLTATSWHCLMEYQKIENLISTCVINYNGGVLAGTRNCSKWSGNCRMTCYNIINSIYYFMTNNTQKWEETFPRPCELGNDWI